MKQPDLMNFQPIDKLKLVLGSVMNVQCNQETLNCYINPSKINYDEIDELSYYQQEQYVITLDRIINLNKFNDSKKEEGFEEFQIKLKDIGDIQISR